MSEDAAVPPPPDLSLRGPTPRVMRLSRKAMAVLGIAGGLAIGGALTYGLRSATHTAPVELVDTANPAKADAVQAAPKDYTQVPKLGPPLPGDLGGPIVAAQGAGKDVVPPPIAPVPPAPSATIDPRQVARQHVAHPTCAVAIVDLAKPDAVETIARRRFGDQRDMMPERDGVQDRLAAGILEYDGWFAFGPDQLARHDTGKLGTRIGYREYEPFGSNIRPADGTAIGQWMTGCESE